MCYFNNVFSFPQATIDSICHALNDPKFGQVDLIVGTGMSGLLPLMSTSKQSGIPCAAVRKNGGSHSYDKIEPPSSERDSSRYVIIDDLTDSGETIKRIQRIMAEEYDYAQCVGMIFYQNYGKDCSRKWFNGIPVTQLSANIHMLQTLRDGEMGEHISGRCLTCLEH